MSTDSELNAERRRDFERRRKQRNLAILVALMAFAILIYVVTLVKFDIAAGAG